MKKIISLLIAIIMVISVAPVGSADTLSQGAFMTSGDMGAGKGVISVELVPPAEKIAISGVEMEIIIPEKLSFSGNITTPLAPSASWEIKQSASYKVGKNNARKLYIEGKGATIPTDSASVTVVNVPVSFSKSMQPGTLDIVINVVDIASNSGDSVLDYFYKTDGEYTYTSSNVKYRKSITSATVTGITNMTYTGTQRKVYPTVKLDGVTLKENTDYSLNYKNNTKCGLASVVIQGKGGYKDTVTKTYYIIPESISDIACKQPTVSGATINWKTSKNADGYYILRSNTKTGSYSVVKTITDGSTSSYTDNTLLSGTTYYYKVQSYMVIDGKKIAGILTSAAPSVKTSGYTLNPTSGLKAQKKTSTSVSLKWNKTLTVNDDKAVSGYYVYRSTSANSGYSLIATISSGETLTYKDTGLAVGKTYYYRVQPYRTYRDSICKGGYASLKVATYGKVGTVSGLKKSSVKATSVKLSWSAVSTASGYEIYHSYKKSSGYELVKTTTSKSYTHSNTASGVNHYYKVRAYRTEDGKKVYGSFSSVLTAKTKGHKVSKPTKLKISSNTTTKVKLKWKKVSKADGYIIYRSTKSDSGFKKIKTITKGSTVTFTNKKLSAGTTYYYRVEAYRTYKGVKGISQYASLTACTKPTAPKITLKKSGKTAIKITSAKVRGADGYEIYYSTKKGSGYKKAYTGAKNTYTKKSLKKGKKYYVKIRAYKTVNGKKYYGAYSKVGSVKL